MKSFVERRAQSIRRIKQHKDALQTNTKYEVEGLEPEFFRGRGNLQLLDRRLENRGKVRTFRCIPYISRKASAF